MYQQDGRQFERLARRYPKGTPKLVEGAANGHAIISTLSRYMPGILEVVPRESKLARARAANVLVASGNVFVPARGPQGTHDLSHAWVDDFVHQLRVFPKGVHDDDVDAFSQGIGYFMDRPWVEPASVLVNPEAEDTRYFDALGEVLQRMRDRRR
jgi:predicted phage terminase large subunit-like protein